MERMRLAETGDLPTVEQIVDSAYGQYVERIGRKPAPMQSDHAARIVTGQTHFIEQDGKVLGLIVLIPQPDALMIENVAVAPEAQGQGIGRRLLEFAEATARATGQPRLRLYTHAAMTESQAIYARLGYRETRRITEDGLHRIYMEKPLPPS